MNRLIDKTLNSLFKLAERLTGTQAQPTTTNSWPSDLQVLRPNQPQPTASHKNHKPLKESALPKLINGFKANYLINHIEGAAL